jgi:diketogulonate reductase-like aldo/keto reductase
MDLSSKVRLNNGVELPWVGFGVFQTPPGEPTYRAVMNALAAGYRAVDTASFYRNEKDVGRALRDSGIPREEVFVTTKVWNDEQGYERTLQAFRDSMKRLGLEQLDLYLVHWPIKGLFVETYHALEKLYRDGEVRAIGVSNFLIHHLDALLPEAEVKPVVDQVEFHPFLYQADLLEYCRKRDIQLEAWSPLTRGRYLGDPVIDHIAGRYGKSPAQVLLRWDLQHGVVTLPRSGQEAHIRENTHIFDFELSADDMLRLDSLDRSERVGPHPDDMSA